MLVRVFVFSRFAGTLLCACVETGYCACVYRVAARPPPAAPCLGNGGVFLLSLARAYPSWRTAPVSLARRRAPLCRRRTPGTSKGNAWPGGLGDGAKVGQKVSLNGQGGCGWLAAIVVLDGEQQYARGRAHDACWGCMQEQ